MENRQVGKTGLQASEVSLGRNNRRHMKKSIFISVLVLILSFNSIFIARAIPYVNNTELASIIMVKKIIYSAQKK